MSTATSAAWKPKNSSSLPYSNGGTGAADELQGKTKNYHGGVLENVKDYLGESLKSLVPPHIRRKGFVLPPFNSIAGKFLSMLSLPYFPWYRMNWSKYPEFVGQDVLAGLTVGIMLVPQGLAYSMMATLPPIYGLYAATIAGYVYSFFGTSGQLTIGPVALVSLFLGEVFTGLNISLSTKDKYATFVRGEIAAVLSLAVGLQLCAFALFRIGSLMRFVSPSVMTGFVTGSGVYIFISQSKYMFGFKVPRMHLNYKEFQYFFNHLTTDAKPLAMSIGLPAFAVLVFFYCFRGAVKDRLTRLRVHNPRLAIAAQTALASVTLLTIIVTTVIAERIVKNGGKLQIVGAVPSGFNNFQLPAVFNDYGAPFTTILLHALPITFLTYMESISVGQKFATVNKYALDMTQELWALGLGAIAASFFQAYPPGGSFSRTALKAEVGVKTPFANIVTSAFVTLILVAATRLLYYVPQAVLGAIICTAVVSLFDFHEMWRALWVAPVDFFIMVFTFVITVFWNVEEGLKYGLLASIVVLLVQISKLDIDSIGQLTLDGDKASAVRPRFRAVSRYPGARQNDQVKILHLTANLFFGNVSVFRDEFYRSLATGDSTVRAVVVDANGVVDMDLSSLAVIDDMVSEVSKQGVRVFVAGAHVRLVKALDSYDLLEDVGGRDLIQLNVEDVYYAVLDSLQLADYQEAAAMEGGEQGLTKELAGPSPTTTSSVTGGAYHLASNAAVLELATKHRSRSNSLGGKEQVVPVAAAQHQQVVTPPSADEGKDERFDV